MPPVYTEPLPALKNIAAYVNFIKIGRKSVYGFANFNAGKNVYIHSSVNFLKNHDLPSYVNFINKNVNRDIKAYVNFVYHNVFIPASVHFVIRKTFDIHSSVNFPHTAQLPVSVRFFQNEEVSLPSFVVFRIAKDIHSSVNFRAPGTFSLPAFVFLGSFHKDIRGSVIFNQFGHKDFKATLQINKIVVQKSTNNISTQADFPASMYIRGRKNIDIPSSVKFRVPPFDIDLPSLVHFNQFSKATFPAQIIIQNKSLGGGGLGVILQPGLVTVPGVNSPVLPVQKPPQLANNAISVSTDSTGYFSINGLSPGNYTIIPQYLGLQFSPAAFHVTITNSNVQLYFDASGKLVNQVATTSSVPAAPTGLMCLIDTNNNSGGVGSFSIEGYIGLKFPTDEYRDILTIITDEDLAKKYRRTIDSRFDLDT